VGGPTNWARRSGDSLGKKTIQKGKTVETQVARGHFGETLQSDAKKQNTHKYSWEKVGKNLRKLEKENGTKEGSAD